MNVLAVNAGSSSLKLSLLDEHDEVLHSSSLPAPGGRVDDAAVARELNATEAVGAVGHRIVHGGAEFFAPVEIDDEVERRLQRLVDLAPLHQPASLRVLELVTQALPDVPHVACFDTAFHAR